MSKLRHRVMLAVVVACGISTIFSVDRNYRPIARIDPSQELTKFAGSSQESTVPAEPILDGSGTADGRIPRPEMLSAPGPYDGPTLVRPAVVGSMVLSSSSSMP